MKLSKLINEASTDMPLKLKVLQAFDLVQYDVYLEDALDMAQAMADDDNKDWISPADVGSIIAMLKDGEYEAIDQIKVLIQILRFIKLNKITRIYVH